ncbi:hypothetical protein [Duganella sp. HH101]|uniref:hypothetical protein n=1 Tax=Duganella sp. HH101 TaxID=1781066 RepID=UPI000874AEE8|nr:hypothetical protein [Duganella sp. HH101]OFA04829.1 hypothetical protein DUGA2_15720 [Duganella sp. HH101]
MTQHFDSAAERAAAPIIKTLGGERCDDFAPLLPRTYHDYSGAELTGKPDFLIRRGTQYIFIEVKAGVLNGHYTLKSSYDELASEYRHFVRRCPDGLSHSELSGALFRHPNRLAQQASRNHGFNHSLFKLTPIQAQHGWQRYLVVFEKNPSKKEAIRYHRAGLIWCTVATLYDLLNTIELAQHGWIVPFVFKTRGYSFTITPEPCMDTPEQAEANARVRFTAGVEADKKAAEAYQPHFDDGAPF